MATKDYYQILGVPRDATEEQIRQAYKRLARKHHPDVNPGDKSAEERFKEVAEAYAVLGSKEKRAQYDRGPESFDLGFDPSELFRRARRGGVGGFDPFGFDLGSIFEGMFAGGGGRRGPARGGDVEASLTIDFVDAVRGATIPLTIQRGQGGSGERLQVRIPPGVAEGSRVRLARKGAPGQGGPPGDLYVAIHVRPHPVLRREGDNLIRDLPLTFAEAALGAKVDVGTLDGTATLTIPPGTRSGQRLRLRGKGVPRQGGGSGDLHVIVQIVPPAELDEESRSLLRSFSERNPQPGLRES